MLHYRTRRGSYHDSIVLMQLRVALADLPGIDDAGAVMGTPSNLEILRDGGLLPADLEDLAPDDLLVVVRTENGADEGQGDEAATAALDRVGELLARRRAESDADYRPKSLASALRMLPEARWVMVSVPGRYAAEVAREALERGRNVFLFSDGVPLEEEKALKETAAERGLLVMGPDCGTALVAGTGLGFANRVRRGPVGLVAASGTGLQAVAARVHALGSGISHALGTGGRDLSAEVGGASALRAIELLGRDPATGVLVLISKPPSPEITARMLAELAATAQRAGKPAVVCLLGRELPFRRIGPLRFAGSLSEAAALAVDLAGTNGSLPAPEESPHPGSLRGSLRGLFSGGTLAQEALLGWTALFGPVESNLKAPGSVPWDRSRPATGHRLLDLGDDALTVGRPHPMLEPSLVAERLAEEARDPGVAAVLLDVVLGDGAHPDPAAVLAPAVRQARATHPELEIVAVLIGTDLDPQDLGAQRHRLEEAGARVVDDLPAAQESLYRRCGPDSEPVSHPIDPSALEAPLAAVNVGVESFHEALIAQEAESAHVDWRPPAGGDERLASILRRMSATAAEAS